MLEFLITGAGYALMYILPLAILPMIFAIAYKLQLSRKSIGLSAAEIDLFRLNFTIFRYVAYLLMIPMIMLLTSVIMGYIRGFASVMDSMPGLIAAITVTFSWCIYRLVLVVGAKSRYEQV